MAYVRQGAGRARIPKRGFGQLDCPSMEQGLQIIDPNDPCQASLSSAGSVFMPLTLPGSPSTSLSCLTTGGQLTLCPTAGSTQSTTSANTGAFTMPGVSNTGVSNTTWILLAVVLGAFVLIGSSGK